MKKLILVILPLIVYSKAVKVDEILTDTNKVKLETAIAYTNIHKKQSVIAPITYKTLGGDFVNIPTYLGNSKSNQDYINYRFSLKYGFSKNLEIFTNLNLFTSTTHISDSSFISKNNSGFSNLNTGFVYQVKKEDDKPSLLIGASADLIQKTTFSNNHSKNQYFKGYSLFATSYYTVDPIVFLIKASLRINKKQSYNNETIKNGNIFILNPNIYFAVNPYTSMHWGVKYQYKGKDRVNGKVVSNSGSSVGFNFGVSYEINYKTTLNFEAEKLDTDDYSSNSINLSLVYNF